MVSSIKKPGLTSEIAEGDERHDYDASNPKNIKARQRKQQDRADEVRAGLRYIMSSREGRAWVWDFLGNSGEGAGSVFATSFHSSNSVMAFHEGERNRALKVLAALQKHCPELYLQMQAEQQPDEDEV